MSTYEITAPSPSLFKGLVMKCVDLMLLSNSAEWDGFLRKNLLNFLQENT